MSVKVNQDDSRCVFLCSVKEGQFVFTPSQYCHVPNLLFASPLTFSFHLVLTQFRINEYGTVKVVSADKPSPAEPIQECQPERNGDDGGVLTCKGNPIRTPGEDLERGSIQIFIYSFPQE